MKRDSISCDILKASWADPRLSPPLSEPTLLTSRTKRSQARIFEAFSATIFVPRVWTRGDAYMAPHSQFPLASSCPHLYIPMSTHTLSSRLVLSRLHIRGNALKTHIYTHSQLCHVQFQFVGLIMCPLTTPPHSLSHGPRTLTQYGRLGHVAQCTGDAARGKRI